MRIKDRNIYRPSHHWRVLEFFLIQTGLSRRWSSASFGVLPYTDRTTAPLIIGEFWRSCLYKQDYLAADHRRVFEFFLIQTRLPRSWDHRRALEFFLIQIGLSRRWSSASFGLCFYTDRTTSPLIIGEFWSYSLYRQNFFAADHRRVLEFFLVPTKLLRCWSSASFGVPSYTDRTISPLIIGEFWSSSLFRQNYFAANHRRVLDFLFIQTELPRRRTSAGFPFCILVTWQLNTECNIHKKKKSVSIEINIHITCDCMYIQVLVTIISM